MTDEIAPEHDGHVAALPGEIVLPLPATLDAARTARAFIRERWHDLPEDVVDDTHLIVTELIVNAVQHGEPDIVLHMRAEPLAIDVSVLDRGDTLPPTRTTAPGPTETSGRGLYIIDRLANQWGVTPLDDGGGKVVWARLTVQSKDESV